MLSTGCDIHPKEKKMARLFYMSLPGVGRWDHTIKQVGAQLRPYRDYLWTAKKAALARKPVLAWRAATEAERLEFQRRLDGRWERQKQKARKSSKRRDRYTRSRPSGVWIVLEAPPWQPEVSDDVFDAFLDARGVHDSPHCDRDSEMNRADLDREGRALLLDRFPEPYPLAKFKGEPPPPTAQEPHGDLLWLRPNTYTLDRQLHALQNLEDAPSPRLAPLVRLASTRGLARWPRRERGHRSRGGRPRRRAASARGPDPGDALGAAAAG